MIHELRIANFGLLKNINRISKHIDIHECKSALIVFCLIMNTSLLSIAQVVKVNTPLSTHTKIFVNANTGNNSNNGSSGNPLLTLDEAAKRVNSSTGKGAITIYLSKGIYGMAKTADFNPVNWVFTKEDRLTIRAEVLPDDAKWSPAEMPVMFSTMPFSVEKNDKNEITGGQNFGILVQNSHVTIQGLRILGEPVHENPSSGELVRNYPIVWEGNNLEDLRVTQCLFIGNKHSIPNHLAILANGKALEVDHCVFYGVKDALVMWNSPATNSSMHHNLIVDSYGGIVWTWSATDDFKFYNNAVSNSNIIWILEKDEKLSYGMKNSVIVGYKSIANKGGSPQEFGVTADPTKIKIDKSVILKKEGKLDIDDDQTSKRYMHIKPGTLGSDLGAGLFLEKASAQNTNTFKLSELQKEGKLISSDRKVLVKREQQHTFIDLGDKMVREPVWIPLKNFKNGKIEMLSRGKDILQGSFYGIAFHAQNDSLFDVVYCRPFNYQTKDSLRRSHAIQYGSFPKLDWQELRVSFPGMYENGIENAPKADDWVTLTLHVKDEEVKAYINHAGKPSLVVKKLNNRTGGKIGVFGFNSDIESVVVTSEAKND